MPDRARANRGESRRCDAAPRLLSAPGMSPADGPPAMPTQPAASLDDERRPALGTGRSSFERRHASPRDEDLAVAATIPIDGDSLATKLVRELVRSFHLGRRGLAPEVDRLADGSVDIALEGGLHA